MKYNRKGQRLIHGFRTRQKPQEHIGIQGSRHRDLHRIGLAGSQLIRRFAGFSSGSAPLLVEYKSECIVTSVVRKGRSDSSHALHLKAVPQSDLVC